MENKDNKGQSNRIGIIETVQTPLGFFALTVLVVEVILGLVANFSQGSDRTYLIIGMLVLIFLLVVIVSAFAYFKPEALAGKRSLGSGKFDEASKITKLILIHKRNKITP